MVRLRCENLQDKADTKLREDDPRRRVLGRPEISLQRQDSWNTSTGITMPLGLTEYMFHSAAHF